MKKKLFLMFALLLACAESNGQRDRPDPDRERRREHQEFQNFVEGIVGRSSSAVANERERSDVKTLQWLLRDYRKHIADGNWNRADDVKKRMNVVLQRTESVAVDAPRRHEEEKQKQADRRHRAELKQRERHHREQLQQRERQFQELRNRQFQENMNQIRKRPRTW